MKKTFFNIIVVSYNAGDKLIDTIESVRRQSYTGYRILVKDGMSTDGSIEKLKAKYDIGKDLILVESCDSGLFAKVADTMIIRNIRKMSRGYLRCLPRYLDIRQLIEPPLLRADIIPE